MSKGGLKGCSKFQFSKSKVFIEKRVSLPHWGKKMPMTTTTTGCCWALPFPRNDDLSTLIWKLFKERWTSFVPKPRERERKTTRNRQDGEERQQQKETEQTRWKRKTTTKRNRTVKGSKVKKYYNKKRINSNAKTEQIKDEK